MGVLESMHLGGKGVGRVVGKDGAGGLEDGGTLVVAVVDVMDGDSTLLLAGSDDGLVDVLAVHSLTPELGKQGRVDVDNPVGIGSQEVGRHFPEEPGEDNEVNGLDFQAVEDEIGMVKLLAVEDESGHSQAFGPLENVGVGLVAKDEGDPVPGVILEETDDIFGVRT